MNDKELQELIEKRRKMMAEIIDGFGKLSKSMNETAANLESVVETIKKSV